MVAAPATTAAYVNAVTTRFLADIGWPDQRLRWQARSTDRPIAAETGPAETGPAEQRRRVVAAAAHGSMTALVEAERSLLAMSQPWAAEETARTPVLRPAYREDAEVGSPLPAMNQPVSSNAPLAAVVQDLLVRLKASAHPAYLNDLTILLYVAHVSAVCLDRLEAKLDLPSGLGRVRQSLGPWTARRTARWLAGLHGVAAPIPASSPWLIDSTLVRLCHRIHMGAGPEDIRGLLPDHHHARARATYLMGEAAYRAGRLDEAEPRFRQLASLAPHVTLGHRRLGQIAYARGAFSEAARHFEAAAATPHQLWFNADISDRLPQRIFSCTGWYDIYRFRGQLFAVRQRPDSMGVTVIGDQLVHVVDSPAYRFWCRFTEGPVWRRARLLRSRESRRDLARALRERAGRMPGASGLGRLARRMVRLLRPQGPVRQLPERTKRAGRLRRWLTALLRSPLGRGLRRAGGSPAALRLQRSLRAQRQRLVLVTLRTVFRCQAVPPEQRDQSFPGLLGKLERLDRTPGTAV